MTRTSKTESVSSQLVVLRNWVINLEEEARERNPPPDDVLRNNLVQASNYEWLVLERNRLRTRVENLEEINWELRRGIREVEEENWELRRRVERSWWCIILGIILYIVLVFFFIICK